MNILFIAHLYTYITNNDGPTFDPCGILQGIAAIPVDKLHILFLII